MRHQVVAVIEQSQRDEVENIWERINSLNNIILMLAEKKDLFTESSHLYDKVMSDIEIERKKYDKWWSSIGTIYNLETNNLERYSLDFSNCEIIKKEP